MKIARITEEQLYAINEVLKEISWLADSIDDDIELADFEDFKLIKKTHAEEMLIQVCDLVKNVRWEQALMSLEALMEEATNPDAKILELSPKIKKGLELLERENEKPVMWTDRRAEQLKNLEKLLYICKNFNQTGNICHNIEAMRELATGLLDEDIFAQGDEKSFYKFLYDQCISERSKLINDEPEGE